MPRTRHAVCSLALAALLPGSVGCSSSGGARSPDAGDAGGEATTSGALGASCRSDEDCRTGFCLDSEYGPPFCSKRCADADPPGPCPEGPGVAGDAGYCVDYSDPPVPDVPAFSGETKQFCVPRCNDLDDCDARSPAWESCEPPEYLGVPVHSGLGDLKVCMAPSFQGKDPVDPDSCNWRDQLADELQLHASEGQLCERYCQYLRTCKLLPDSTRLKCCEWGCFNRMVRPGGSGDCVDDGIDTCWKEQVRCFVEEHLANRNTAEVCSRPRTECADDPDDPEDPTPKAAAER